MSVRVCACVGRTLLSSARGFPRGTEENAAAAQLTHSTPRSLSAFHSRPLALMLSLSLSTLSARHTRGLTHARCARLLQVIGGHAGTTILPLRLGRRHIQKGRSEKKGRDRRAHKTDFAWCHRTRLRVYAGTHPAS